MTLGTGGRGPQARSVPQGPAVLAVAQAPFVGLAAGDSYSFLVGSESARPWPAGPVRPSGPCCFGVAEAPFVKLEANKKNKKTKKTKKKNPSFTGRFRK